MRWPLWAAVWGFSQHYLPVQGRVYCWANKGGVVNYNQWGNKGDQMKLKSRPITGSKLWASWCSTCGQPIRVSPDDADKEIECQDCEPREISVLDRCGTITNQWDNIVRAYEDAQ